jgi:ornithine cyclodeaminase/alanine dehydrogenase-like protein (mu-crystallin family)
MSENQMLVLNRADLESLGLTWTEIIDVLDDAFQQKARGLVQNPSKPKVTSREDSFIHAMPAYLGGSDRIGLKWVAGYEQNNAKGLPYIYGVMIMNDAETGRPIALLDGGWITEMRTPGVSGVTMRHVPGEPKHLAIVGCGLQGHRHLEVALDVHPGLTHVTAYDRNEGRAQEILALAGDRVTRTASSPTDAVAGADLVITTPSTVALDAVQAGKRVAVAAYGLSLPAYEPLPLLNGLQDWRNFAAAEQLTDEALRRASFLMKTAAGDRPAESALDYVLTTMSERAGMRLRHAAPLEAVP